MNELVQIVSKKTGLPEDKAQMAVETVVNFLKGKLPAISGQLDALISGQEAQGGIAEKAKSMVAGFMGKKA